MGLRRRAHRLKALVDVQVTKPTPLTMPLAVVVNSATRIEADPARGFERELGLFSKRLASATAALQKVGGLDANITALARAWLSSA